MLLMNLSKLTLNHLIVFIVSVLFLMATLLVGVRMAAAVQVALSFDEALAAASSTQLNRNLLNQAIVALGGADEPESPVSNPDAEVEPESETEEESVVPNFVEIVNTTSIEGGASQVAVIFPADVEISLRNGTISEFSEIELDESLLLYKNGYSAQVQNWRLQLEELGWVVGLTEELPESSNFDVIVVLNQ
jgi:hypothetical protein